jgi:hypothetical protein
MFRRKQQMDPKARQMALSIAGSRVAVGVAAMFATRPALRAMRFPVPSPTGEALTKLGGGRDIVLGTITLALRDDPQKLRTAMLISNFSDLADAVAFAFAARHPETRRPAITGVVSGGAAALSGFWAWRRLTD